MRESSSRKARGARASDLCVVCGKPVHVGEDAYWDTLTWEVWHDRHGESRRSSPSGLLKNRRLVWGHRKILRGGSDMVAEWDSDEHQ